jgi:tetratricopeptide (TPR) repeat protein
MREAGRIDEALIAARHATKVDPNEANAWWQLALAVLAKDGQGAAVPHFKKTVELSPSFAYGWYRLGFALKKSGMTDEAVDAWVRAIEEDPVSVDALNALVDTYGALMNFKWVAQHED